MVSTDEDSYIFNQNKQKANVFLRFSLTRCLTFLTLQEVIILTFFSMYRIILTKFTTSHINNETGNKIGWCYSPDCPANNCDPVIRRTVR